MEAASAGGAEGALGAEESPPALFASPEAAADAVVDSLRQLLSVLGCLMASEPGQQAAKDAAVSRSLPALGKALTRFWFETPLSTVWDSKEQARWLCRLLMVTEGSRAGVLSYYGAGILVNDALTVFAKASLGEMGIPVDEEWTKSSLAVHEVLCGQHSEQLQRWEADRRAGEGSDPVLSLDRLPISLKRVFDLEGVRLTRAHAAGLGVAFLMPGSMTLAMGGVGCALLLQTARGRARAGGAWERLQERCLQHAHQLLRRKTCPIEVRFESPAAGLDVAKVCLYSMDDPLCAVPVGGLRSVSGTGTGGEGWARLLPGDRCSLRPPGEADTFRLRIYSPAPVFDTVLHDGVEVKRGDRVVIVVCPDGKVRCYAEGQVVAGTGETRTIEHSESGT